MTSFEQRLSEALGDIPMTLNPDYLLRDGSHTHSFYWSIHSGLWVDPNEGQSHSEWLSTDQEFEQEYDNCDDDGVIMGRYGLYHGMPVVAVWWTRPKLRTCLRDLMSQVGPKFVVTIFGSGDVYEFPPQRSGQRRTHQYWQMRQTSESRS